MTDYQKEYASRSRSVEKTKNYKELRSGKLWWIKDAEKYNSLKKKQNKANKANNDHYRTNNSDRYRRYRRESIKRITVSYMAQVIGVEIKQLYKYPELIEAKRIQLKIKRLIKNKTT